MGTAKQKREALMEHIRSGAAYSNDYQPVPTGPDGEEFADSSEAFQDGLYDVQGDTAAAKVNSKIVRAFSAMESFEAEEGPLDGVLKSTVFQATMALLIMANAIVIGLETDIQSFHHWDSVENFFLLIFAAELGAKYYSQGTRYFFALRNPDIGWNAFDAVVVGLGGIDLFMSICYKHSGGSAATLFRVIRLLRIMRLFRIVKFLKQLYLLAFGFVEAIQAIFWVTLLLIVILYVCAIVMVRTCGRLPPEDPHAMFLHENFANIGTSMLTLFVLMSSPNLPKYIEQDNLLWERPLLLVFLVSFIIIGSFGMIALLTGVISESMFEKNQIRAEESRKEQDEFVRKLGEKACEIHAMLDLNEDGDATKDDIAAFAMPQVARLYEEAMVDFTEHNLEQLVEVMDHGGDGLINSDEFKSCIITYASGVKPLSIQEVHYNTAVCINKLDIIQQLLEPRKAMKRDDDQDGGARSAAISGRAPEWFEETRLNIDICASRMEGIESQLHLLASRLSEVAAETYRPIADLRLPVCSTDNVGVSSDGCSAEELNRVNGNRRADMDSTTLHDALRELDTCIRDCARRQLSGQQYLEFCIRENLKHVGKQVGDQLKKHVGEELQVKLESFSSSWKLAELSEQLQEKLTAFAERASRESRGPPVTEGPGESSEKINAPVPQLKGANAPAKELRKQGSGSSALQPASRERGAASGRQVTIDTRPPEEAEVPLTDPRKLFGASATHTSRDRGAASSRQVSIGARPPQARPGGSRDPLIKMSSEESGETASQKKVPKTLPACLLDV